MADKPTLNTLTSNSRLSVTELNENFDTLATAIQSGLGRGGTAESPNSMSGNLDMNLNRIQNLGSPSASNDAARLVDISDSDATGAASAQLRQDLANTADTFGADLVGNATRRVANYTALQAITSQSDGDVIIVRERSATDDGGGGVFYFDSSDLSSQVTSDPLSGVYVAPNSDATGASGAWVRQEYQTDIVNYGADQSGDDSPAILAADATGKKVLYPQGTYLYQGATNPTFSGGVEVDNATVVGMKTEDKEILVFDSDGETLVGLQQNHLEQDEGDFGGSNLAITTGTFVAPPVSKASLSGPVDILAHWFNDFGLERTRAAGGGLGDVLWYYWDWNHTDAGDFAPTFEAYDASRHPLLGWYRGDDQNVLDWQCYWLKEYGINGVILDALEINTGTWSTPSDVNHWVYQLATNVPNFKNLKFALWGKYDTSSAAITSDWQGIINNFAGVYPNYYSIEMDGKLYPVIFVFEGETLRTTLGGTAALKTFLAARASDAMAQGFDGIAVLARNATAYPNGNDDFNYAELEKDGVIYLSSDYHWNNNFVEGTPVTYDDLATNWTLPLAVRCESVTGAFAVGETVTGGTSGVTGVVASSAPVVSASTDSLSFNTLSAFNFSHGETITGGTSGATGVVKEQTRKIRHVPAINTSADSKKPHPTTWTWSGQTPSAFRAWLSKAIKQIVKNDTPRILSIYNVAEWAEGGPGLQPNVQDGFGFLEAVKEVVSSEYGNVESTPVVYQGLTGTETIDTSHKIARLWSGAGATMTSTPTLAAGSEDGQIVILRSVAFSGFTGAVTLQDRGTLSGSDLYLTAATITISPNDSVIMEWDSLLNGWVQVSNVVNVL